ncbi:predicted protein [Sclerotinia sclerotiorum 1980 UF-70]|nr:predicted protein [Sclerotinia sclerotiorum 1980 UF-70]EDO01359.1 predicted protein [Sclerotinia sclerotiorum 1980 UF-70]
MAQRVSMDIQQPSLDPKTQGHEEEELSVRMRKTTHRIQRNEQRTDQGEPFSLTGTIRTRFSNLITNTSAIISNERRQPQLYRNLNNADQQPHANDDRQKCVSGAKEADEAIKLKGEFDGQLENNNQTHLARERQSERRVREDQHRIEDSEDVARALRAKIEQLESEKQELKSHKLALESEKQELDFEKQAIEEKHNTFILKQQETTFSHMAGSRWAPVEDSKVMEDLGRLKRDMRSWAKKVSSNDMDAVLKSLDKRRLRNALEHVVVFEHGELPQGLSSRKVPALLLSALLAHDIYTTIFRDPFFFLGIVDLGGGYEKTLFRQGLEETYRQGLASDEEDTHVWRSHTLRLFLPPMKTGTSEGGRKMHARTEYMIENEAYRQALNFLHGAAKHLIEDDQLRENIFSIYREAAIISYNLWTRRTKLVCYTLHDGMGSRLLFHPNSKDMTAHSSVDYGSHADQLKGRPISIILHPCLMVYGTDDGKDYHQGRVWAPAEVWLDSRKPSAE